VTKDEDRIILAMICARDAIQSLTHIGSDDFQGVAQNAVGAIKANPHYKERGKRATTNKSGAQSGNKQGAGLSYAGQLEGWVLTEEDMLGEISKERRKLQSNPGSVQNSGANILAAENDGDSKRHSPSLVMLQSDIMLDLVEAAADLDK
jgi:hypothetical protein